jgi:hypothetical protein
MIMRMALDPSSDEGKRIHKELRDLLEAAAVQQAQSSVEKRHPKASVVPVSSAHGAPEGHPVQSGLRPAENGAAPGREPSLARSRFVRNHNANQARAARRLEPGMANSDQLYTGNSDPDDHGRQP